MISQVRDIWRYRELLRELFLTWLKVRHTGSVLGVLWTLLNPAVFVFTYWVVFSYVIRIDIPAYGTFLIPGYLAWNFTWSAIAGASESMIESSYLITKVAFPSEILVLASVGVSLFDFLVALGVYLVLATTLGVAVWPAAGALPAVITLHVMFTLGLSFLSACGAVFFRDIPKLVSILGLLLFFATPIFYPQSAVPENLQPLLLVNPFAPFIALYHHALYLRTVPPTLVMGLSVALSLLILAAGLHVFHRFRQALAEWS
jgi:ABC-type polysaccharide/polyol phosphate export permease